jgi:acetyl-CoA carboxylase biotin carboxyl carrier protein
MSGREPVADLVAIVDRLETLLERSALAELEVETEGLTIVLRSPAALMPPAGASAAGAAEPPGEPTGPPERRAAAPRGAHAVVAPLTGVYYRSPSPGAEPYVREGGPVNAGQVIGLIEAMKLFNEIKSDITGTVRHIAAGDGDLVKAGQPLVEVDPS